MDDRLSYWVKLPVHVGRNIGFLQLKLSKVIPHLVCVPTNDLRLKLAKSFYELLPVHIELRGLTSDSTGIWVNGYLNQNQLAGKVLIARFVSPMTLSPHLLAKLKAFQTLRLGSWQIEPADLSSPSMN